MRRKIHRRTVRPSYKVCMQHDYLLYKLCHQLTDVAIPMNRLCDPEDIANMATFLASDEASFITGTIYEVDGGRCIVSFFPFSLGFR